MRREVFFAPEPADPDRYLKLRGRRWHYVRRVPEHVASWDRRGTIQLSLRTPSLEVARIKRDELAKADDLYWSGVSDGVAATTADATYQSAKKRGLGFAYLTADRLADLLPLDEVFARIARVQETNGQEAPALLGAHEEPKLKVRAAMEFYFDTMAVDEARGMSAAQHASWKKVKRHAVESFIKAVGNKPLLEITRVDAQSYYDHWQKRIAGKIGDTPVSANFANRNFGNMRKLFRTYANWLALDIKNPFDGLSFRNRKSERPTVPSFSPEWITSRLLEPGALDHLNCDARLIFLTLIETGCRPSEVCNIMPENIRLDHDVPHLAIRFRADRLIKTEASVREIPLVGVSLEAMKRAPNGFPRYRDKETNLSATLMKALRKAQLLPTDQHTVYSMRHAFEKRMQEAGLDYDLRCQLACCRFCGHEVKIVTMGLETADDETNVQQKEFKIEAVRLVTERGVAVVQVSRDLDVAESVLRRWVREANAAPATAFPGNGLQRAELTEIAALKKEVAKLKAERDILKNCPGPTPACAA